MWSIVLLIGIFALLLFSFYWYFYYRNKYLYLFGMFWLFSYRFFVFYLYNMVNTVLCYFYEILEYQRLNFCFVLTLIYFYLYFLKIMYWFPTLKTDENHPTIVPYFWCLTLLGYSIIQGLFSKCGSSFNE